jgi:ubiquinone/menaquinone biosynthesis C-methylase UbiE
MTQPPRNTATRVCSCRHAWGLDNRIRKIVQNPYKIVGRYIEEGQTVLDLGCGPGVFSLAMAEMVSETGKADLLA